jgi:subtilisin-like proprotein convertase family protein
LAANTPNDGTHDIAVPNIVAPNCRIMIEPVDNIYYAVNSTRFSIGNFVSTCTTYPSSLNLNLGIPDGTGAGQAGAPLFHTINIPDSKIIDYIVVNVDVSHGYIQDLIIQIQHPDGTTFTNVWNRNCGSENDLDVFFEDGAIDIVCAEPTSGNYAPANPLSVFSGLNSSGDWTIAITDSFNVFTGVLNDWHIEICEQVLDTPEFDELVNFSIFPNPNKGTFNVKMNALSNKNIDIAVYDIRGRKVYDNRFVSSLNFDEEIQLNNAQSGFYLVKVSDGLREVTKKIIIE